MSQNLSDESIKILPTLSHKEHAFVDMYFHCNMNATEAYQRLHPKANRDTSRSKASDLVTNGNIAAAIEKRLSDQAMGKSEVLSRLSAIARASEFPFIKITPEGFCYFDFSNPQAEDYLFLIKKIKTKRTRRIEGRGDNSEEWEDEWVEVELYDAQQALATLAKYHGMLTDTTMNVDMSALSTAQVERIAKGEDVMSVLSNPNK